MNRPQVPILSQLTTVSTTPSYFIDIRFNIFLPPMSRSTSCVFPSGFPNKTLYAFVFSPVSATWPACLILLDLIILITFDEE
jgi:hypothetical protein